MADASARSTCPTVLYLAGSGRSGSTLVERTIGAMPGFVNVGELIDLTRRVAEHDELCGCGLPFGRCPFWTAVGADAFGGWSDEVVTELRRRQRAVARQRHLPKLMLPAVAGSGFEQDLARFGDSFSRLFAAIAARSGAEYVVDASKWPAQALALSRAGLDVRIIHLIRDARGVAHSLSQHVVARPHAVDGPDLMWRNRAAGSAARWTLTQAETEALRGCGVRTSRLRYEDFVSDPRGSLAEVTRDLGLCPEPHWFGHIGVGEITLDPSHGLSGNSARFDTGRIPLRDTDGWKREMSGWERAMVGAITFPVHRRYRRADPDRTTVPAAGAPEPTPPPEEIASTTWPSVSVVIPTRGRPELLRDSLASVIEQTYPGRLHLLVVHDQEEPDRSAEEMATPTRRITVTTNQHKPGLAGARNTALDLADGEFIATCDDDDTWHPDKLVRQVGCLLNEPDLLVVGAGLRLRYAGDRFVDWPARDHRVPYRTLLRNRVKELHSSTLVMRRDAFAKAGRYDEDLPHGYGEDYDWVLRAARVGRIGAIREPLADIRKDVRSWYAGRAGNTADALVHFLGKHPEIRGDRRGHARVLGQIAFSRSSAGDRAGAFRYAGRALRRWPVAPYAYLALGQVVVRVQPARLNVFLRRAGRGLV